MALDYVALSQAEIAKAFMFKYFLGSKLLYHNASSCRSSYSVG
jgi:hypothetical protein